MAQQIINNGDTGLFSRTKINDNFTEVYGSSAASLSQTGWLSGGALSAGTTNVQLNVSAGTGLQVDTSDPDNVVSNQVAWEAFTDYAVTIPANTSTIGIGIDYNGGTPIIKEFVDGIYTYSDYRDYIILGVLSVSGGVLVSFNSKPSQMAYNSSSVDDFLRGFGGVCLGGNELTPNGANLKLDKAIGDIFVQGINAQTDSTIPSVVESAALTAPTMALAWRDSTDPTSYNFSFSSDVDPDQWDNGSGTLQAMPSGDFTTQLVFLFGTGLLVCYYGQETYGTRNQARNAIRDGEIVFEERTQLDGGVYLGAIVVGEGQTDLTSNQVLFFQAPCLRKLSRGWGGGGTSFSTAFADITGDAFDNASLVTMNGKTNGTRTVTSPDTPTIADAGKTLRCTNGFDPVTITINRDVFEDDQQFLVTREGAGSVTFVAGSNVEFINADGLVIAATGGAATVLKLGETGGDPNKDVFLISGNLTT